MGILSLALGKILTTSTYPPWSDFFATWMAIPAAVAGALLAKAHGRLGPAAGPSD